MFQDISVTNVYKKNSKEMSLAVKMKDEFDFCLKHIFNKKDDMLETITKILYMVGQYFSNK